MWLLLYGLDRVVRPFGPAERRRFEQELQRKMAAGRTTAITVSDGGDDDCGYSPFAKKVRTIFMCATVYCYADDRVSCVRLAQWHPFSAALNK